MRRTSLHLLRLTLLTALTGCPPSEKPEDTGDTAEAALCVGGESILLDNGDPSGFERCDDGAINRVYGGTFDPAVDLPACVGDEDSKSCYTDADCTDRPYGACITGTGTDYGGGYYETYTYCGCAYACATDADCAVGEACIPDELSGRGYPQCIAVACLDNADCPSGECGYSDHDNGCGQMIALDCRTEADACHADADCAGTDTCWSDYDGTQWVCGSTDCAIGRPLLVSGDARVAAPAARHDWADTPDVSLPFDPAVRAALAAHWREVAALEHASVASFARVTLQLLALGAPSDLVADTQQAAADEVRHARLAYGLASRYGGAPVGPGPLALTDALPALDARGVMQALVQEACIGETLGAAELLAAADTCVDTRLAAALRAVGEEEARHAALAWRTLQWLLGQHPAVRDEAHAALRSRAAELTETSEQGADLSEHGVLGGAARLTVRRVTLRGVLGECIDACFSRAAA